MSATTQAKPGKGKWLIMDRLAAGCRALAAGGAAWAGARDVEAKRGRASLARIVGGTLSMAFVGGTLYALSRGVLLWGSVVVGLLSAWVAGGSEQAEQATAGQPDGYEPGVFLELLHDLAQGSNLHLIRVREQLQEETGRPWSGPQARALCDAAGVRVRDGVRVPGARPAVTTGIHRDDLPPLPSPASGSGSGVVGAGQAANNNTNKAPTVTEVGQAAMIVHTGPSIHQEAHR